MPNILDAVAFAGLAFGVIGWVTVTIRVERAFHQGDYWDAQDWVYDCLEWFYARRAFFVLGTSSGVALWLLGRPWWWSTALVAVAAVHLIVSFLAVAAGRRRGRA